MAVPKDEISVAVREWYYAASEGQQAEFFSMFVQDESATYFGTDPHEVWYGFQDIRANMESNFKKYGKWTIMSKNLNVKQFGEVAVFTDEVEFSAYYKDNSIAEEARVSGVLLLKNGAWKILQAHLSFGVPNDQLLPD